MTSELDAAWLAERRSYLGGTDLAALAGVNPPRWRQPIDVYLEKVGLAPERPSSRVMMLGRLMEDLVAQLASEATGLTWRRQATNPATGRGVVTRHPTYPYLGANVDRWGTSSTFLEAKWSSSSAGWGPSMEDDDPDFEPDAPRVPLHYMVQVQHYLGVTGREAAILAVLLGYADFRWYRIRRDERLIDTLRQLGDSFWHEHVLRHVPPEPDGSEGYGAHLRRLYASDSGAEAVATPEQAALVDALRAARAVTAEATRAQATIEQRLQASMGSTAILTGPGFRVSWRQGAEQQRVSWQELAVELARGRALALGLDWPATKKGITEWMREYAREAGMLHTEPGTRPFRPTWDEEDPDGA